MATLRLLEILRDLPRIPKPLHASSSEIFGQPTTMPLTEESPIILQRNADQKAYRYDHGPLVARKGAKESGKPIVCILLCPLGARRGMIREIEKPSDRAVSKPSKVSSANIHHFVGEERRA